MTRRWRSGEIRNRGGRVKEEENTKKGSRTTTKQTILLLSIWLCVFFPFKCGERNPSVLTTPPSNSIAWQNIYDNSIGIRLRPSVWILCEKLFPLINNLSRGRQTPQLFWCFPPHCRFCLDNRLIMCALLVDNDWKIQMASAWFIPEIQARSLRAGHFVLYWARIWAEVNLMWNKSRSRNVSRSEIELQITGNRPEIRMRS